jgi:hypothetical protein
MVCLLLQDEGGMFVGYRVHNTSKIVAGQRSKLIAVLHPEKLAIEFLLMQELALYQ